MIHSQLPNEFMGRSKRAGVNGWAIDLMRF